MNGMKKLLGVIGILALAAALLPAQGYADLRGSFALVSNGAPHPNGIEQPAIRPGLAIGNPLNANQTAIDLYFAYTTRSLIPGREGVRSIFQLANVDQAFLRGFLDLPLKHHPTADISYFDPAWSHDGRYLAYAQQDFDGGNAGLYVQEYDLTGDEVVDATPVGAPILVYSGSARRPAWHPSQHTLSFDHNAAGSFDVYTVDVLPVLGVPVRRTFDNLRAEQMSSWHPNGHDIVYSTNKFGPNVLEIVDIAVAAGDPGYIRLAEANFKFVSHNNADFSSDGNDIFYDAPSGEDPNGLAAIWKLNLPSQSKCEVQLDILSDADPSVSGIVNETAEGIPYNDFMFVTQSGGGLNSWRGNAVNSCLAPLPMSVDISPPTINLNSQGNYITADLRFPQETKDAGYVCRLGNVGGEGVRARATIFASPVLIGIAAPVLSDPNIPPAPAGTAHCIDIVDTLSTSPLVTDRVIRCWWTKRTIANRMVALGLTDKTVGLQMTAYTNWTGRSFQGFGYVKVTKGGQAGSVALLGNSPNPFNPVTKIKFAVEKAGNYAVKVYNVHGALVKTLADTRFDAGVHEVGWDGRNVAGSKAASGVYYAKVHSTIDGDESNSIRLVLAK
jgi:hypothetical protein